MIDFEYQVIRSKRQSIGFTIQPDGMVIIRCPDIVVDEYITELLEEKADRIRRHIARLSNAPVVERAILTDADVARLKQEAKTDMPERVACIGAIMDVMPDDIRITTAHKRWACCIRRGNHHRICFSYRVMLLPEELRDFTVKHELAHITEMRHSPAFYSLLSKYEPNHHYMADLIKRHSTLISYYVKRS